MLVPHPITRTPPSHVRVVTAGSVLCTSGTLGYTTLPPEKGKRTAKVPPLGSDLLFSPALSGCADINFNEADDTTVLTV